MRPNVNGPARPQNLHLNLDAVMEIRMESIAPDGLMLVKNSGRKRIASDPSIRTVLHDVNGKPLRMHTIAANCGRHSVRLQHRLRIQDVVLVIHLKHITFAETLTLNENVLVLRIAIGRKRTIPRNASLQPSHQ